MTTQVTRIRQRLGAEVARARTQIGLSSQQQLAEEAGLGRRTISAIETGEKVAARSYFQVEAVLGWPTGTSDDFIAGRINDLPRAKVNGTILNPEEIRKMTIREIAEQAIREEELNGIAAGEAYLQRALEIKASAKQKTIAERKIG
jgi:transcriptional regulator with XRE-family HTH domain